MRKYQMRLNDHISQNERNRLKQENQEERTWEPIRLRERLRVRRRGLAKPLERALGMHLHSMKGASVYLVFEGF